MHTRNYVHTGHILYNALLSQLSHLLLTLSVDRLNWSELKGWLKEQL